jgi:hypothetical protein
MKLPINVKLLISLLLVGTLISLFKFSYNKTTSFYNTAVNLELQYIALDQKQNSNYTAHYEAFKAKQANANFVTKNVFIEVTKIIMTSRQDGQNVAWKWLQENQQIPYSEFTYFYKELSDFISIRYNDYMLIEQQKQQIAKQYNSLIKSYPGNVINLWFKFQPLNYSVYSLK